MKKTYFLLFFALIPFFTSCQKNDEATYTAKFSSEEVQINNRYYESITSNAAVTYGFIQEDTLTLRNNNTFLLKKEMKTTISNDRLIKPVKIEFSYEGKYSKNGNSVNLSKATSGKGSIDWGSFADYMDLESGYYTSKRSSGIYQFYPSAYFVENAINCEMTVKLDRNSFNFEPFNIQTGNAGSMVNEGNPDDSATLENAGLMNAPLVKEEDMHQYYLKDYFSQKGLLIGTCYNQACENEPAYSNMLNNFSSLTSENDMKAMELINLNLTRKNNKITVSLSDRALKFLKLCREKGIKVRSHNLIWYAATPDWIFNENFDFRGNRVNKQTMLQRMEDYIKSYFEAIEQSGYSDLIYCVDVVNEAITDTSLYRDGFGWYDIIGEEYVKQAFVYAKKYAPKHIKLVYNDFDLEAKKDKIVSLINDINKDEQLVDVIGLQGHYSAYFSTDVIIDSLKEIALKTGLEVQATEIDVVIPKNALDPDLKAQGRFYYNLINGLLKIKEEGINLTSITFWGHDDSVSWQPASHPCLYDRNHVAKYAFFGVRQIKELAGFDEASTDLVIGNLSAKYVVSGQIEKYIQLNEDGTFIDTTQNAIIEGKYYYYEDNSFLLQSSTGLTYTLVIEGDAATRVEFNGGRLSLIKG